MRSLLAIAKLTWTELLRDRFVVLFGFLAFLMLCLSLFLGSLTFDEQRRLLLHLGFAGFEITLVGLSLFLGSWTMQKELDRQTCLLVLSRPVSRAQFLLGKWLGGLFLISLFWVLCGLLHLTLLGFGVPLAKYLAAYSTIWVESFFLLSLAFFFATFLKPLLALASTFSLWLAGHWRDDLAFFAKKSGSAFFLSILPITDWIFPPLNRLEARTLQFVEAGDPSILVWPAVHLFFWSALLLFFAQMIWRRRDLI